MILTSSSIRLRDANGFALLITITLLAFLVLLLVSLAVLTRVETQVAGNSQQMMRARKNALFALNIALGQLQKYAGPDQRVTATADMAAADTNGNPVVSGVAAPANTTAANGLVAPQAGTRYWIGVWGNSDPTGPGNSYKATPPATFMGWLVSGNEDSNPAFDTSNGILSSATAATVAYKPTSFTAALTPASPLIIPGVPDTALLVGSKTAGATSVNYVVAPIINIQVPANQIPGQTGTTLASVGRYAYWVGDEGLKAKYNLRDPYVNNTNTQSDAKAGYRFLSAGREGVERIDGYGAYPVNNVALDTLITASQQTLIDGSLTLASRQARFHDVTLCSYGLLVDTQRGGLRRDLTYYFEQSVLDASLAGVPVLPTGAAALDGANVTTVPNVSPAQGVKWDLLKSYYDLASQASAGSITVRPATTNQMGIAPVLLQNRTEMFINIDNIPAGTCTFRTKVAFVIGNPYDVKLNVPQGLDFSYKLALEGAEDTVFFFGLVASNNHHVNPFARTVSNTKPNYPILKKPSLLADGNSLSVLDYVTFHTGAFTLDPGEVKVFMIPDVEQPAAGVPAAPFQRIVNLAEGASPDGYFIHDPGAAMVDAMYPAFNQGVFFGVYFQPELPSPYNISMCIGGTTQVLQSQIYIQSINAPAYSRTRTGSAPIAGSPMPFLSFRFWPLLPGTPAPLNTMINGQPPGTFTQQSYKDAVNNNPTVFFSYRAYADFNLRAATAALPPSTPLWTQNQPAAGPNGLDRMMEAGPFIGETSPIPGQNSTYLDSQFTSNLAPPEWGRANDDSAVPITGQTNVVLFDIPRRSGVDDMPILSIGQLQHANVTADDVYVSPGYQPGYAIGNSWFSPFVDRGQSVQSRKQYTTATGTASNSATTNVYDISYLYNTTLWDRYFFSSIPQNAASTFTLASPLPNSRLKIATGASPSLADLRSGTDAARYLMINGAFNINSTSVQAWAAVLSGLRSLALSNDPVTTGTPYPRTLHQTLGSGTGANASSTGNADSSYAGIRRLTDDEIYNATTGTGLAVEIVKQIRQRGPFLSLAHFINRKLSAATDPLSASGALQAAIDNAGVNAMPGAPETVTFNPTISYAGGATTFTAAGASGMASSSTGVPGWLTQADVLQALGPNLSARSDTFIIRTYGEATNPATSQSLAQAWCEAVVQRLPDYVDNITDLAAAPPSSVINKNFGRRFKVVSFRWLSPADI